MIISLIVAMDEQGGIGKNGKLPWHLSADLKLFKNLTWGHCLVMGRLTFQSIGRPLPGRTSIVISRNKKFIAEGCLIADSLDQALHIARGLGEEEVFIIGGGQIFALALPMADRLHLTRVHAVLDCDVFFPQFDINRWLIKEQNDFSADDRNEYDFTYYLLERN